jgi:hypothetical protein
MKIKIEMNNTTFSVEAEEDSLNITEMVNHLKGLLVLCGYHPKNVDDAFTPDEFEWFPEAHKIEDYLKSEGFEESEKITISSAELDDE